MSDAMPMRSPVQLAYHVPDAAQAARDFARQFGWGPFYLMEHIPLAACVYRGQPAVFDHTSAYGQAGEMMVIGSTDFGAAIVRFLPEPEYRQVLDRFKYVISPTYAV